MNGENYYKNFSSGGVEGFSTNDGSFDYAIKQKNPIKGAILITSLPEASQNNRLEQPQELYCDEAMEIDPSTQDITASY